MKIIYPYSYFPESSSGGHIHVNQFIQNIECLGHEIVTLNGDEIRNDPGLKKGLLSNFNRIRKSDVIYYRVEEKAPKDRLHNSLLRKLIHHPIIVWEFNTVPEFASLYGKSKCEIDKEKTRFRSLAKYCDLAVCVSRDLERYVREEFGIEKSCFVPNGSDPEIFGKDIPAVNRITRSPGILNVVWIGNAGIGWHDFDLMKNSARLLCEQGYESSIQFHVLGGGMGTMSDMPGNISYYGCESYKNLPHWLAAMDVGLVLYKKGPADYNSPLKLFDYMASGLAIAGTMQPQISEIFTEMGTTDLLIPTGDYKKLAEKLVWLLNNRDKAKTYGEDARKLLINKYTWRQNALTILDEINKIQKKNVN